MEGSGLRCRGAIAVGRERSQVEWTQGAVLGGGKRSQGEGSGLRWVSGAAAWEQSLVEGMGSKITFFFFNFEKECY